MSPRTEPEVPGPPLPLLREMVRESERVCDIQRQSFARADARSEQMIALGLVTLGAGLAMSRSFEPSGSPAPDPPFLALMGGAMVLNAHAILTFLRAYLRPREHSAIRFGPSPEWIANQSRRRNLREPEHLRALLVGLADDHFENLSLLQTAVATRDKGLSRLTLAALLYGAAGFYIAVLTS